METREPKMLQKQIKCHGTQGGTHPTILWEVTGLGLEVDQLAQNLMTTLPTISFCPLYPTFSE